MGLISKFLGGEKDEAKPSRSTTTGSSSQFAESQSATSLDKTRSRNAPRRDLVRVVLRETMRRHGIPSDWIDCRSLSVLTRHHKSGMHVQFLVRKADHQLLPYVHALQESFWDGLLRIDPGARDWLFSVGWEFYEKSVQGFSSMPDLGALDGGDTDTQSMESDTLPPDEIDEDLATDLQALQAVMSVPADLTNLPDAAPRKRKLIG
ncbi:MAG TPA: hypothetical protein VL593_04050 [Ramlibacter sp.]|nr:hypothetical protein [Ramlibacter sp.]